MSVKRLSMLLVGVCLVSVRGKYEMFEAVPGNVTVLQGSPLSLIWSMNRAVGDIGWCEWSYRDASSSSVTPFRRFLGFSHTNNFGRDNISARHSGWQFIDDNDGCGGGLIKKVSGSYDIGQYQIVIEMQRSVSDKKVYRDIASVIVVAEADLEYFVAIDDTSYHGSVTNTPSLPGDIELKRDQSLALNVSAPYADDVTIYWKTHIKHCGERQCALQVNASEKTISQIIFSIDYNIQGVDDLELKLNATVQLSEAASNVNIAAIILGVLFAILIIGVLIAMWMFYKRRKRPHKMSDEEDLHIVPKQPDDNSLNEEPPHDCMEPKLHEDIDRLKKEYDDQIVELNSKETRLKEEYENKLRLKQEEHDKMLEQLENEHQVIIDEKEQLIDRKEIELAGATSDENDREKLLREEIERKIAKIYSLDELNRKNANELKKKEDYIKAELSAKKLLEEDNKRQKTEINKLRDLNDDITKKLKAKDANIQGKDLQIADKDGIIRDLMRKGPTLDDNQLKSNQPGLFQSVAALHLSASNPMPSASGDATVMDDDTHGNRQQWERDRDELLQKVDDIMVIYQNHLKEYGLPQVKEELQHIYGDIAEKLNCIATKRKQRPHDDEYIKSLDTYQKLSERSLDTFLGLIKSTSPQGYQYINLNQIETTLGVIKHCQTQLENMLENTQLDGNEIIQAVQMKLQMWTNLNRTITGDLITCRRGTENKLKYLVIDKDKANTAWKITTERYDHILTDPVVAE